jgi:integrase
MTVARWANEWLETYKRPVGGDGMYANYTRFVNKIIVPVIGSHKLKSIRDIQLQKILNNRAGKSKSEISKLRMVMKAMFHRAYKSRIIPFNPAEDLELPAAKDGTNRSITDDERAVILSLSESHHAGLWVKMMLYCGLRPGETRALDWKHIDIEKKLVNIRVSMKANTIEIGTPKSAAGIRDIPIPNIFLPILISAQGLQNQPVFTQPTTGKRHTKESMADLWNNFKRHLDLCMGAQLYRNRIIESKIAKDLTPYCLRHTYCTDLEIAGVPINIARYLMGHSDIALTSKIYTHTGEKAIQEAAKKINEAFNVGNMVE